eukprot:scaffold1565_cov221-Amphora_coffeaeformis.AAC.6
MDSQSIRKGQAPIIAHTQVPPYINGWNAAVCGVANRTAYPQGSMTRFRNMSRSSFINRRRRQPGTNKKQYDLKGADSLLVVVGH